MHTTFLKIAAVLGALSVVLGAFGAHALKKLVPETALQTFETGVRYQFYHVFALVFVALIYQHLPVKWTIWAGNMFITGIVLFSGSLYVLTWLSASGKTSMRWIGAITPFGGLAFIAGWVCLLLATIKK